MIRFRGIIFQFLSFSLKIFFLFFFSFFTLSFLYYFNMAYKQGSKIKVEMDSLLKENEQIKKSIQSIGEQIEQQKELNQQHEAEIETLLKFNERLLSIIENQLGNKDNYTLQPISERSERDSDLIGPTLNSLIKSKRLIARSERGGENGTHSLIGTRAAKLGFADLQKQKSEVDHSLYNQELSQNTLQQKTAQPVIQQSPSPPKLSVKLDKKIETSSLIQKQMSNEINELKKFKNESMKFFDNKINHVKGLSSKLSDYQPMEQIKKITEKLTLSPGTSQLIKKAVQKKQGK